MSMRAPLSSLLIRGFLPECFVDDVEPGSLVLSTADESGVIPEWIMSFKQAITSSHIKRTSSSDDSMELYQGLPEL